MGEKVFILEGREADLHDFRWLRAASGSSAMPVASPAKAGSRNCAASRPPAEAGGYGSYGGFAAEGRLMMRRSVNG
jgi:hypothetical protein